MTKVHETEESKNGAKKAVFDPHVSHSGCDRNQRISTQAKAFPSTGCMPPQPPVSALSLGNKSRPTAEPAVLDVHFSVKIPSSLHKSTHSQSMRHSENLSRESFSHVPLHDALELHTMSRSISQTWSCTDHFIADYPQRTSFPTK